MAATLVLATTLLFVRQWQPSAQAETGSVAARSPVTVSFTYDDGSSDQLDAAEIMSRYGFKGTFYLNSSLLGASGRLSVAQATALQSAGHEIGGHTVTHADLPTLSADEQARQVCNDRTTLLSHGLQVSNFAYPYGDDSPAVQQVVQNCGYNSARIVGGIASSGSCYGCPTAEKLPPVNPYAIATPESIKPGTSLEAMQNLVLQAEENGGGWVVLVMHRVCDRCDPYAVAPSTLDSFSSWLAGRGPGGTVVKTVADVIGGPVRAAVPGPAPQPQQDQGELIRNTSMETDSNGDTIPDCWQRGGYGANTASWSNAAAPHTGSKAMRVSIDAYTDGDRRIITQQDLGACAPKVVPGHTYRVAGWYRSAGSSRPVAYYRDGSSRWQFLGQAPLLTASSTWRQSEWTTPALPADAGALSVGLSLRSSGMLEADDFSVQDTDATPPQVALTSPADGSRARGTVTFTAVASDASGIDHVDFLVNGEQVCRTTTAPHKCAYDTTAHPDSVIAVTARATDTAGNVTLSSGFNFTVSNSVPLDTTAPSVSLIAPAGGSVVNGTVTLSAAASDDDSVIRVLYSIDGEVIGAPTTAPYTLSWNTTTHRDGPARIQAKALDASGNVGESEERTVEVSNYQLDSTPPVTSASCGTAPCDGTWFNTSVTLSLSATDADSGADLIMVTTDGSTPTRTDGTRYVGPLTIPASTTVKYRAWDRAGNAEAVHTLDLKVDKVAPTARVSAPDAGATISRPLTYYKTEVTDDNGIARVLFYVDDVFLGSRTKTPYQWVWDTTNVPAGPHKLQVVARDVAGNETRSAAITITAP
ncbi:Ig-like domain-containing protein [Actinoplanes nipponensis]|uniref:Ig-like domain-containing protein n=1 Tax=Actinoplanes nipponensis TaxID=135950 RepID=UPI00194590DB|nr:Ig-like domain-containing protein [Actinoplanes nipponensis]